MSSMFCTKIYSCKNKDWCARDFNPKSSDPECFEQLVNYDRITSKTPHEMAAMMAVLGGCPLNVMTNCPKGHAPNEDCNAKRCWFDWLMQEVKE